MVIVGGDKSSEGPVDLAAAPSIGATSVVRESGGGGVERNLDDNDSVAAKASSCVTRAEMRELKRYIAESFRELSGQLTELRAMVQQAVRNTGACSPRPENVGGHSHENQLQELERDSRFALWKNMASRKHWVIRGRMPPETGESAAELQALLGDRLEVTFDVAQQLRGLGDFDIFQFKPRGCAAAFEGKVHLVDSLDFLRQALVSVLRFGLVETVAEDTSCLARIHALDTSFANVISPFRALMRNHMAFLNRPQAKQILGELINEDLLAWVEALTRWVFAKYPAMTPPHAGTVFEMPPLPEFPALGEFMRPGGTMYNLMIFSASTGAPAVSQSERVRASSGGPRVKRRRRNVCRMFLESRQCSFGDNCKFSHDL